MIGGDFLIKHVYSLLLDGALVDDSFMDGPRPAVVATILDLETILFCYTHFHSARQVISGKPSIARRLTMQTELTYKGKRESGATAQSPFWFLL